MFAEVKRQANRPVEYASRTAQMAVCFPTADRSWPPPAALRVGWTGWSFYWSISSAVVSCGMSRSRRTS